MKKKVFLAAAVALGTMLMTTPVFAGNYGWNRDGRGWWYQLSNGSYVKSSWLSINGTWYSMDSTGYMETGWVRDGGGWYYMDTESGAMRVGWVNVNGNWYYLNPADGGRMLANSYTPDGYYVDGNGVYQPQSKRQTTTVNRTITDNTDTTADDAATWQRSNAGNDAASPEEYEDQVIELVNQERAKQGLSPLKKDTALMSTADVRAEELETLFSHDRPDGTKCYTAFPGATVLGARISPWASRIRFRSWIRGCIPADTEPIFWIRIMIRLVSAIRHRTERRTGFRTSAERTEASVCLPVCRK